MLPTGAAGMLSAHLRPFSLRGGVRDALLPLPVLVAVACVASEGAGAAFTLSLTCAVLCHRAR